MENQSQSIQLTEGEFNRLTAGLYGFLGENHDGACLDDEEDRSRVAEGVIGWLLSDKIRVVSPDVLLPKAKYHLGFNVVDEYTHEHIIRLVLDRTEEMEDEDFLQLQNFFWTAIGRAIRDNPEIIKALEAGGVRVEIDPPEGTGGQQAAL
jgi:hypothetical protein